MYCVLCGNTAKSVLVKHTGGKSKFPVCDTCALYKRYNSEVYDLIEEEYKTSAEWQKLCKIKVITPTGWDSENFKESWFENKITREEFERRMLNSKVDFVIQTEVLKNIWKDIRTEMENDLG